ncbi:MAG TPA: hypothetical protein VIJ95_08375 [Hanamia sp.]
MDEVWIVYEECMTMGSGDTAHGVLRPEISGIMPVILSFGQ